MPLDVFESPFAPVGNHSAEGKPTLLFVQSGILFYGSESLTGLEIVVNCSRYNPRKINKIIKDNKKGEEIAKISKEKGIENLEGFSDTDLIKLSDLESIINLIRKEYIKYSCNPFLDPKKESEIKSEHFGLNIRNIIDKFNEKND